MTQQSLLLNQTRTRFLFRTDFWLYLFLSYPLLDFLLKKWLPLPVIPSLWDEGVLFILLVFTFFHIIGQDRPFPPVKTPLTAFVMLGLVHIFIDMPNFAAGLEGFRAVFQYVLPFLFAFYLLESRRQVLGLLRFFLMIAVTAAAVGVAQVLLGVQTPASWIDASEQGLTRAFSFVISPNVLGSYMALAAPVAVSFFFYERKRSWKWVWAAAALLILMALLLSGSRGAWLALFASVSILFVLIDRRLLLLGIGGAVAAVTLVGPVRNRIVSLFSEEYMVKSLSDGRLARWLNAFDQMSYDPLFARGIGHYGGAVGARHFGTTYVDSYFFKTLAELGLVGIILFIWLMAVLVYRLYRTWKNHRGEREHLLLAGLFTGLFAVILHNGVENIFEVPFMNSYFWFLNGLVLAFPYLTKGDERTDEK